MIQEKEKSSLRGASSIRKESRIMEILHFYSGLRSFCIRREIFSGEIVSVRKDGCLIKFMVKSGFYLKRPKDEDIVLYPLEDVKRKIAAPQAWKRGHLQCLNSILFGEFNL